MHVTFNFVIIVSKLYKNFPRYFNDINTYICHPLHITKMTMTSSPNTDSRDDSRFYNDTYKTNYLQVGLRLKQVILSLIISTKSLL